ncbi:DUF6924 domain-containing protein [Rhodococcus sp. IEGM 1374]|uniref:DUF6924 domain-containing protein n=1 Tax=Rhodococcus sp. IEGM 1374 TaxID=3082221 RepID=UPI002955823B|nr:hypothetical protein [Rhodococcus sp. IEGM 1374]MDV7988585.1 hypothetical protein [Rhodococcus sp. IEGM 1374]
MPDGTNNSELWLLRTYFGDDDDIAWTTLAEQARRTRSSIPGAALVVSSDRTQCQERIRRVLTRLATRAEANDGLYVAIADKQTFVRHDRMLLTIDCSAVPRNAERVPTIRMAPPSVFRLGIDGRSPNTGLSVDPDRRPMTEVAPAQNDSEGTVADFTESVGDAIRASLRWRTEMTRDGSCG